MRVLVCSITVRVLLVCAFSNGSDCFRIQKTSEGDCSHPLKRLALFLAFGASPETSSAFNLPRLGGTRGIQLAASMLKSMRGALSLDPNLADSMKQAATQIPSVHEKDDNVEGNLQVDVELIRNNLLDAIASGDEVQVLQKFEALEASNPVNRSLVDWWPAYWIGWWPAWEGSVPLPVPTTSLPRKLFSKNRRRSDITFVRYNVGSLSIPAAGDFTQELQVVYQDETMRLARGTTTDRLFVLHRDRENMWRKVIWQQATRAGTFVGVTFAGKRVSRAKVRCSITDVYRLQ